MGNKQYLSISLTRQEIINTMIIITPIIRTFVSCLHNTLLPGNSCDMGNVVNTAHNQNDGAQ